MLQGPTKKIENPQTSTDSELQKLLNDTKSEVPSVDPESDDVEEVTTRQNSHEIYMIDL